MVDQKGDFTPSGAALEQPFDQLRFSRALQLENKFFDYSLGNAEKERVVQELDASSDILLQGIAQHGHRRRTLTMLSNLFGQNDNIPALNGYGYSFIDRHLPQLESFVISSRTYSEKKEIRDFILRLSGGDRNQQKKLVQFLQRLQELELSRAPRLDEKNEENSYEEYIESFGRIFFLGTEEQIIASTRMLASAFEAAASPELKRHVGSLIANTIWTNKPYEYYDLRTQASRELAIIVLKEYGLDYSEFAKVWASYLPRSNIISMAARNISTVIELEAARPEIARTLHQEFNISLFQRYPLEVLIDQFDQRDNTSIPYAVMFSAIADHNKALGSLGMSGFMQYLHSELKKVGGALRVYECGSEDEVKESLVGTNSRYGAKSPRLVIIAGHGEPNSIEMNWRNPSHPNRVIRKESLQEESAWKFTDYVGDDTSIFLLACSTGAKDGLAQEISKQGITVAGPDQATPLGAIDIKKRADGTLDFKLIFRDAETNVYKNGLLLAA